ncbi:MAG: NADH:ubiquinone oxidoreductase subunit NDUFA12 [Alphaproteobacteria bacterium]
MGIFSFLGVLSPAHISLFTATSRGKKIGKDQFENTYYEAPARKGYKRPRRWVMYKGRPEASAIPPEWHGWIHHQTDVIPSEDGESFRRDWQKPYEPNLTGTNKAYRPKGHILEGGKRNKATGDYEAWVPSE